MNRELFEDYQRVLNYLKSYSFGTLLEKEDFVKQIKNLHRKIYALLLFQAEFEVNKGFSKMDEIALKYLKEVSTDIVLSFFCFLNGTYKSAKLQLRCSIENFMKSIVYSENADIILEKKVYEIFNLAENSLVFSNEICKCSYRIIYEQYKDLCLTVHGASSKLTGTNAMIVFPQYNKENADSFEHSFCQIVEAFLTILYYTFYSEVYKMHELNRELFLQAIKKKDKASIQEEKALNNI